MTAETTLLAGLRRTLEDRHDVRLALLFGSRARGRARPGSDADLAVEAEGVDLIRLACELSDATGTEVEVVDLKEASYPLLKAVVRDGVVVHEAEPGAAARWRSRAIAQLETDRPWFERMRDAYLARLAGEVDG